VHTRRPIQRIIAALLLASVLLVSGCSIATQARRAERWARFHALGRSRLATTLPAGAAESTPETTATLSATATGAPAGSLAASAAATPTAPAVAGTAPADALPLLAPIATIPAPKPAKTLRGGQPLGVPVLMYHVIGTAPAGARNRDLYVPPQEFVAHLTYLSTHGYHVVTLQQVYDFWQSQDATLPSNPVVLSFDDGDSPDFTIAAPLLSELHWPGTLNLIVGRKHLRLKPGIIRALIAAGWEIDSHTMTHTEVAGLGQRRLVREIAGSRRALQRLYGVPVNFFCYPAGRFDAAAVAEVKAAGYLGATTTMGGLARPGDVFLMRRVRVSGGTSARALGVLLSDAR
jgi:peptidoglycan/xylan/chitin deacetylase (PgdA/CDA1 family)